MSVLKIAWTVLVEWTSKAWEAIKKLPGWAVVALLLCGALVVWLIKQNALARKRSIAQENLKNIELEYREAVVDADATHDAELEALRDVRDTALDELKEVEEEIEAAAEEGPVKLAQQWKSFLARRKK